ncbi:MAG: response regulator [Balneolaceae bacterium]|nr:response regulator [Balneolaceae bacterium]
MNNEEKKSVLYVDDETINLVVFEMTFGKKYNIIVVESVKEAFVKLSDHPEINIVISDMRMPEMNGIQFIESARAIYPNKQYLILTGFGINEEILDAVDRGVIAKYLQKPFIKKEVEAALTELLPTT